MQWRKATATAMTSRMTTLTAGSNATVETAIMIGEMAISGMSAMRIMIGISAVGIALIMTTCLRDSPSAITFRLDSSGS